VPISPVTRPRPFKRSDALLLISNPELVHQKPTIRTALNANSA